MKKLSLVFVMVAIIVSGFAADAVALLSASKGKVTLERSAKSVKFNNGELLQNKDVLRTGAESFAAYKYIDGSSNIKVFSNSVVTVNAVKNGAKLDKNVNVNKGSIFSQIKSGTGAFNVQTPTTVASVKGTGFLTKVDELGNSMFIVSEGEVEVKVIVTDERLSVGKGKTAVINADGEMEVRDSTEEDLSALETQEVESMQNTAPQVMRIPVIDSNGRTKYIEITF